MVIAVRKALPKQTPRNWLRQADGVAPLRGSGAAASGVGQ